MPARPGAPNVVRAQPRTRAPASPLLGWPPAPATASAAFHALLERDELLAPELFCLLQPALELGHWLRLQCVDAHAGIEFGVALRDEGALAQHAQVAAHRGGAQAHLSGQLAGAARPEPQEVDSAAAIRIGQSCKRPVEPPHPLGGHTQPVILSPLMRSASSRLTCRMVWPKVQTWPSRSRARYVRAP